MTTRLSSALLIKLVAVFTLVLGAAAALFYAQQQLVLSHYDARAHLVVARRIFDSLRPGWWQIGAVWLPLPHLLNALPVQVDWLYRTGLSAVLMSILSFAGATATISWFVHRATGSVAAAIAGATVFATQPDVLYLQSTPMTEPLLMFLCLLGVVLTWQWIEDGASARPGACGSVLALACLTRYEGWLLAASTIVLAALALAWRGHPLTLVVRRAAALAAWPVAAIAGFLILSRVTIGSWLVTGGFYVIDNPAYHHPVKTLGAVWYGFRLLNGRATVGLAIVALLVIALAIARRPAVRPLIVSAALTTTAALPMYAFWSGHPFRIRYMVVLTMALAAVIGLGIGLLPRARAAIAAVAIAISLVETPPFSLSSPMVAEAQWDRPRSLERRIVTECLTQGRDGTLILASMGSLAHYMQETSHAGFAIRDYIHEGIGQIWTDSLASPRAHAGWVLIEEQAEGGDELARLRRSRPSLLAGFDRVCEGGGVALYRRSGAEK